MINTESEKDQLLFITYVLRAVSKLDLFQQYNEYGEDDKRALYNIITNLVRYGLLYQHTAINHRPVLYISPKGFRYLKKKVLTNENKFYSKDEEYKYVNKRNRCLPLYEHHYMNFKYVWDYVHNNWETIMTQNVKILTDIYISTCKIKFNYMGKELIFRPDVFIKIQKSPTKNHYILVENDTGREQYKILFKKFLILCAYLAEGYQFDYLDKLDLHFVVTSEERLKNLFQKDSLTSHFERRFKNTYYKYKDVSFSMDTILKGFNNKIFSLYVDTFEGNKVQKINFLDMLYKQNESWKHYIIS